MNKKLAIYINNRNHPDLNIQELISGYDSVHIISSSTPTIIHSNISYFCFNNMQIDFAKNNSFDIFLSFIGNDIYKLTKNSHYEEIFWFPDEETLKADDIKINQYAEFLNNINLPICISYNPYINNIENPIKFREFVIKINKLFKNPIKKIEENLLDSEIFSPNNTVFINNGITIDSYSVVLGLFGDVIINEDNFQKTNIKTILTNKDCLKCEFNNNCINRGIGYIINKLKYNGCIGIKLLN